MTWNRQRRAEAILQEKIAVIVLERLADPRLGFVTIVGVELSRDKRVATVKYTAWGTEAERRTTQRALADSVPRVQELLAPTLGMRHMPELRFVYDETVEKESRLLGLIEDLEKERKDTTPSIPLDEATETVAGPRPGSASDEEVDEDGGHDDDVEDDDEAFVDDDDDDDDFLDDDEDDDAETDDFEDLSSDDGIDLRSSEGRGDA
ncbi:MAG: 30S ribosome-binding factor RbfA [Planctomycetes bacterium]|nr:30S ribosome-binding factor RbfA [Planctomycetota bacterium]